MKSDLNDIVSQLEEDIVLWRLQPEERLVEDALMARFGAKRHVVRSALDTLTRMGLVDRPRNRGALVRLYGDGEVAALFDFRRLIEPAAAQMIALPPDRDALARLRQLQGRHDAAVAKNDLAAVFRSNAAFHTALFALCPNPFLVNAVEGAALQAHAVRFSGVQDRAALERSRDDHHAMLDAMEAGDGAALVRIATAHLDNAAKARARILRSRAMPVASEG
ncbi:GntR family transcriptional regulator [Profundibacterium mesophilum]|uniref:Transcriptional regulator GntR family protein n=1 Tax=Profundibacterium mesophilum KAUST100406-0324 TaxID=1037889 RepID=A0A921NUV9_9RHOB|nr:GntR family transcriptional regulator [Profundibacterium mesophilum]KAF0676023.1 Transcriptional regulator GntR family protein [Profundibacterium mesophilum KAUST100406-0324]